MKTTFVLSGGSTKGCFQAGAIKEILSKGIIPDHIYGVSVGSLNGAWLANQIGELALTRVVTDADWKSAGEGLCNFWKEKIQKGKDVACKRSLPSVAFQIITSSFKGLYDTSPIINLTRSTLKEANLKKAPVEIKVGSVNINGSEKTEYVGAKDPRGFQFFLDMLVGSIEMPIIMPPGMVNGLPYFDGGMRDIAPLGHAINDQEPNPPDRIVCILCATENLKDKPISEKKLLELAQRTVDIMTNETVNNDISFTLKINEFLVDANNRIPDPLQKYKVIDVIVIRPDDGHPIELELDNVTPERVNDAINYGARKAREVLQTHTTI